MGEHVLEFNIAPGPGEKDMPPSALLLMGDGIPMVVYAGTWLSGDNLSKVE
jgi:hypothetical protein